MNKLIISLKYMLHDIYREIQLKIRRPQYSSKVFCIGYNKTGTTSCGKGIKMLGYRHSSFNNKIWRMYYQKNEILKILQYTAKYDSFDDLPWLKEDMIPILDKVFPNSKFIYLTRDEDSWKESICKWTFKKTGKYPDPDQMIADYRNHKAYVMSYFRDKPKDRFLILDVSDEDSFQKLAGFLGKTTTQKRLPHLNKTTDL